MAVTFVQLSALVDIDDGFIVIVILIGNFGVVCASFCSTEVVVES